MAEDAETIVEYLAASDVSGQAADVRFLSIALHSGEQQSAGRCPDRQNALPAHQIWHPQKSKSNPIK
jgi:hypothetical protein